MGMLASTRGGGAWTGERTDTRGHTLAKGDWGTRLAMARQWPAASKDEHGQAPADAVRSVLQEPTFATE
eukprot:13134387-Alexandrium_andersonii.AAC.2